jgi:hypothetical protein
MGVLPDQVERQKEIVKIEETHICGTKLDPGHKISGCFLNANT